MDTIATDELWTDLGGMIACRQHMGRYATSALEQKPQARKVETPLTIWRKMVPPECVRRTVTYQNGYSFEFIPACERCGRETDLRDVHQFRITN